MSPASITRRDVLAASAAAGAVSLLPEHVAAAADSKAMRPFRVDVPEERLADLRRRIAATQWSERETVPDQSQGVQLATMQELARYWATDYDWRKVEARLNALPQFMTEIDRLDFHFIHARSKHENALPLVVNHGWSGAIIEQRAARGPSAWQGPGQSWCSSGLEPRSKRGIQTRDAEMDLARLVGNLG